jgi:hypothetical protein
MSHEETTMMTPWERMAQELARREPTVEELFTLETLRRLTALRERIHGHPEYIEFTHDEHRLAFARWLVTTGRLRETL